MFSPHPSARLPRVGARALALPVTVAVTAILAGCGGGHGTSSSSSSPQQPSSSAGESGFDGAPLPGGVKAPDFTLTDQHGRTVRLSQFRGRVVALTFVYSTCGDACVVIAQQLRGALDELEAEHHRLPVVAMVSADPAADTPARVARFLGETSLTGRVEYLTGALSRLQPVWRAYGVKPASAGRSTFDEYASVLLIDPEGRKRVLFESENLTPEGIAHDVGRLEGDPAAP